MSDQLPFEGVKIADFSWVGVGPITTRYLADHGATVVKVESETRVDIVRAVLGPFKDNTPGLNRSHAFGEFNASKYGLALDLKNPASLEIAHRLIAWADVYVQSFTPGTVDGLGIGYDTVRSINPSIIMVSTCLMGQTGPAAPFAGYGFHAGAIAGFYEVTGWPDLAPDGPWLAYTDTVAPRFLAATIMAALDHRRRTGQGQFIDAAQMEMGLHLLSPQIIDYNISGRMVSRNGNRSETDAPHGVYPCSDDDQNNDPDSERSDDRWCAIAVETNEQWEALRRAMGDPEWARDSRFDTPAGRLSHQDEIDGHISRWTGDRSAQEVMRLLQAEGVPSGVAQRSSDLLEDPQLAHRRLFRYLEHGEMGNVPYAGHQFRILGYDSGPRSAAPLLGEHNDYVLREILGMDDEEIAEAVISGAIT
jgi:benzylsuccinate CoA-transferase BbsF subunit